MELIERFNNFMGSCDTYESADTVIVGVPMDFTASYRPGSRFAPQAVRNVSYVLEEYSFYLDRDLADYRFYDWGDINLPIGNVGESLNRINRVAARLFADGKFPVFIGGEHLISYPVISEACKKNPGLAVIQFDAHADLRSDYLGEGNSHATVMRKACEVIGSGNLYQFGIRSGTREELEYAKTNTNLYTDAVLEPLMEVAKTLAGRPVYVTVDIDVADPAFAPGTGTPEPGGISSRELISAVHALRDLDIIGMDVVEIIPSIDPSERTAVLGAKIIREAILGFTKRSG